MTLSDIAINRPVFTTMVILAIVVFGVVSYGEVGVDLFPRVELPVITIVTVLPGADPETIENTVTDPIEESVSSISGIKHLRSVSTDGVSQVILEFELEKKIDVAYQEVVAKIGAVHSQLPRDVEDPVVEKFDVDAAPVLALAISSNMPIQDLTRICDRNIKDRLQKVHSVGQVKLVGGRRRKIWLVLNREQLAGYGLTVTDVEQALVRQHVELPGGRLDTGPAEMIVKTKAEYQTAAEIGALNLVDRNGTSIRLDQVGHVEDGMEEERSSAHLSGRSAVSLIIQRQSGTNTVEVAEAVKHEVDRLRGEWADRGVKIEIAQDLSVFIERSIEEVHFHILFGGGLAIIIVFLFLRNLRSTMISSLVIPTAVIGTFILMNILGFTQNMMTLLALSLSIGLLIDDAIVVQENIMRHVEEGMAPREAASFATREITLAVLATTMSVVAVFVPVAFMKGIVGRFFYQFGLTVTFAVLISMFVSFTLDPMLSSRILRAPKKGPIYRFSEGIFEFIERVYQGLLRFAMRFRWVVILVAIGTFFAAGYVAKFIKSEFLPQEDRSEFNVTVRGPLGSTLASTQATLEILRTRIESQPFTAFTFATIGTGSLQRVNEGALYVKLKPKEERTVNQVEAMNWVRSHMSDLQDVQLSVDPVQAVGNGVKNKQLMYEVRGDDFDELKRLSRTLIDRMKDTPGFIEVESSLEEGRPEIDIHVDREKAADRGVDPATIAAAINALVGGDNVAKFRAQGERYDIAVRLQENERNKIADIGLVQVPGRNGQLVSLRDVAHVQETSGVLQIDRNDRARQVTVMANLDAKLLVLGDAITKVNGFTQQMKLPPGYVVNAAGQAENFKESFGYLIFALLMAVVIVYMVLASQFESFAHPFTIMLSLPLSVIGALGALALFQMTMSIFTMIGIIMLMGLVTKNAILLVDYTNTLRHRDGMDRLSAILKAGPVRLRPILMTTLAMIFGMLPIALGTGSGSESRAPMAVAVIGGLTTSTLLTLIVVPVVYSLVDDFVNPRQWRLVQWMTKKKI
ncbi:MAG TPA: efflux RND transporter permease subunit [Planctomycetota bacterium]|nr:efflux RND transporter permease subunit [Planctomycetota bacterium]